ncbi:unnamed protein product, partial [Prorocentrum cordatum]
MANAGQYFAVVPSDTTGPLSKFQIHFKELATTGPVLAQTGTNTSWPNGVEVKKIKESIQQNYSIYADKGEIYIYESSADFTTTKHELWDEYVVHAGTKYLIASSTKMAIDHQPSSRGASTMSSGVDVDPFLTFTVKIQDTGEWEPIKVPNPAVVHDSGGVRVLLLKKCIISQLALPNGKKLTNGVRIYRNSAGCAKGLPLRGNDVVWKNSWYYAIIDTDAEPMFEYPDHVSPDSLD